MTNIEYDFSSGLFLDVAAEGANAFDANFGGSGQWHHLSRTTSTGLNTNIPTTISVMNEFSGMPENLNLVFVQFFSESFVDPLYQAMPPELILPSPMAFDNQVVVVLYEGEDSSSEYLVGFSVDQYSAVPEPAMSASTTFAAALLMLARARRRSR